MARVTAATKAAHRQRLLAAAASEFASKGLDGARVDEISLAAGLAKGTVYNYFDSKQQIFREVVSVWLERVETLREVVPEDAPVREQLLAIVRADMAVTAEMEEFARVAFREVLRATSHEAAGLLPAADPVDAAIVGAIERGQAAGEMRVDRSAPELARVLSSLVTGMLIEHWLPAADLPLDQIPERAVDYFLDGAGP